MSRYSSAMNNLIEVLKRLPGVGPKSAQRLAFYILGVTEQEVEELARTIVEAKKNIKNCSQCFHITDKDPCEICIDESREKDIICVVEEPKDLMAIERSRSFKGYLSFGRCKSGCFKNKGTSSKDCCFKDFRSCPCDEPNDRGRGYCYVYYKTFVSFRSQGDSDSLRVANWRGLGLRGRSYAVKIF